MKNLYASAFVLVFLAACGGHAYKNTLAHRGSLLYPPGYPPEEHVTETARRGLW